MPRQKAVVLVLKADNSWQRDPRPPMRRPFIMHNSFGSKSWNKKYNWDSKPSSNCCMCCYNPSNSKVEPENGWLIKSGFKTKDEIKASQRPNTSTKMCCYAKSNANERVYTHPGLALCIWTINNVTFVTIKFRVQLWLRFVLFCFQIAKWEFAENVLSGTQTNVLGPAQHAREKGRAFPFNFQNFLKMLGFWNSILIYLLKSCKWISLKKNAFK